MNKLTPLQAIRQRRSKMCNFSSQVPVPKKEYTIEELCNGAKRFGENILEVISPTNIKELLKQIEKVRGINAP